MNSFTTCECCNVLQCVAVCCNVLQCVAVCCSVLQCVAVCCSVLREARCDSDAFSRDINLYMCYSKMTVILSYSSCLLMIPKLSYLFFFRLVNVL